MNKKEMEFVWRPNAESLGTDTSLLTHVLYGPLYGPPEGFNWDILTLDDPWINNEESKDFNADTEAELIMEAVELRAEHYLHNEVLLMFGFDFEFMDAFYNYGNMDNMIAYMNENYGHRYHFQYSTPSNYVDAINQYNVSWPTKYDDMFPYGDSKDSYWTGYFTNRPNHKAYIRRAS